MTCKNYFQLFIKIRIYLQGVLKHTVLTVDNFVMVNGRKACDMSISEFFSRKSTELACKCI